jgi:hypothetical protein
MNVDRAVFLALAASLSAVACASSDDGSSDSAAPEVIAGHVEGAGKSCWDPTTESVTGTSHDFYMNEIGFDPVNDFPSAEGLCMKLAAPTGFGTPGTTDFESKADLFEKCSAFAKIYAPFTTYNAFLQMKKEIVGKTSSTTDGFNKLYAIDRADTGDKVVCITPAAKQLCLGVSDPGCQILASQLKQENHQKFIECMGEGFSAFSCAEGAAKLIR